MLTEEQLKVRRDLITASKVPIILGASPFKSRAQLLNEATNPHTKSHMLPHQERGHRLEPVVAEYLGSELEKLYYEGGPNYGLEMLRGAKPGQWHRSARAAAQCLDVKEEEMFLVDDTVVHKTLRWAAATPDVYFTPPASNRIVEVGEIKTSSERSGWYPDKVPHHIWMQVQWQLFVLRSWMPDLRMIHVGALIQSNFVHRVVEWDPGFIEGALPKLEEFLREQRDWIARGETFPLPTESQEVEVFDADEKLAAALRQRGEMLDHKRGIEQQLEGLNAEIMCAISETRHARSGGRIYKVTKQRPRVNQAIYIERLESRLCDLGVERAEIESMQEESRSGEGFSYVSSYRGGR